MKIQMNKVKCVADRSYNKADDMHLMASIKSRLDKGLKPLLQPIALKKLDGDTQFDYSVEKSFSRAHCFSGGICRLQQSYIG